MDALYCTLLLSLAALTGALVPLCAARDAATPAHAATLHETGGDAAAAGAR